MKKTFSTCSKFPVALAVCLLALVLPAYLRATFPVLSDLPLMVLIGLAFMLDLGELAVLVLLSVYFLNWQPRPSLDLLLFAVLPILAWAWHRAWPMVLWLSVPLAAVLGVTIFWAVLGWTFLWNDPLVFGETIGLAVVATSCAVLIAHAKEKTVR
ncbi:MAG: hypothetical protein HY978_03410 [Candidatus Liptonbacteria bacterium]|nr:hypothetical protein [Candidatus Liptonbacteria bacterium]